MDAKSLLSALITTYADDQGFTAFDLLAHAVTVINGTWSQDDASEWLAEELQERWIAQAD